MQVATTKLNNFTMLQNKLHIFGACFTVGFSSYNHLIPSELNIIWRFPYAGGCYASPTNDVVMIKTFAPYNSGVPDSQFEAPMQIKLKERHI